ncbi:MAG: response regulator [Acidimicrobiales bacterium]|nr:response regulator [Acidimicrobiales bacterium]
MLKRSKIEDYLDEDGEPLPNVERSFVVLVVNDDPNSGELIARLVEASGWQAARAYDVSMAVSLVREQSLAGVIVDLTEGLSAAVDAVQAIRAAGDAGSRIPILVLTSTGGDESTAWRAGADGFLARPFHANDFLQQLDVIIGRSPEERDEHRQQMIGDSVG